MGFLTRGANEEEPGQGSSNEELYERLFPKIGRDFVYREDLAAALQRIMQIVDPFGVSPVDFNSTTNARKRAFEYKAVLDAGKDGSKLYKDLIKLDEEDEEEDGT